MKNLSKEELKNTESLKMETTKVRTHLMELQPVKGLLIEKGVDWLRKDSPCGIINYYEKPSGKKFDSGRTSDGKEWIVKRIS